MSFFRASLAVAKPLARAASIAAPVARSSKTGGVFAQAAAFTLLGASGAFAVSEMTGTSEDKVQDVHVTYGSPAVQTASASSSPIISALKSLAAPFLVSSFLHLDPAGPTPGGVCFDSYMVPDADLEDGQLRLLEVDARVVLPVETHVRFVISSTDVIHDWAIPSLGIKLDAIPGRLNQTSTLIERKGVFYGQCSELCGVYHGFMPIVVEAVDVPEYLAWLLAQA